MFLNDILSKGKEREKKLCCQLNIEWYIVGNGTK